MNYYPYSSDSEPHISQNGHHGNQNGHHGNPNQVFLKHVTVDSPSKRKRPMSAMPHTSSTNKAVFHRTSSLKEAQKIYTSPLPRKNNAYELEYLQNSKPNSYKSDVQSSARLKPSLEYNIGTHDNLNDLDLTSEGYSPRELGGNKTDRDVFSDDDSVHSDDSDLEGSLTAKQESQLKCLTAKDKDRILQAIVSVGDRVLFTRQQKPPKYGKKRGIFHFSLSSTLPTLSQTTNFVVFQIEAVCRQQF